MSAEDLKLINHGSDIRSIIFQNHLQALIDSTRQASASAARARRTTACDIAFDLAKISILLLHAKCLPFDCTFSLRQETQAVIFRLMSGGLRSPKDSRRAAAADSRDIMRSCEMVHAEYKHG